MHTKKVALTLISVVAALIAIPTRANEPAIDAILIPILAFHSADATGATWNSSVSFAYTGDHSADVFGYAALDARTLLPGARGVLQFHDVLARGYGPGLIILTTAFPSNQLTVQSYVYNEARPETGVSIPCVRQSDLGYPIRLLGIPVGRTSRTLLRIYAITDNTDADVVVRIFDANGNPLAVDNVHLVHAPLPPVNTIAVEPAYAEYRPAVDPAKYSSISIDVESPVPGGAIWAFSTTTGAQSDSVTAVFPAR